MFEIISQWEINFFKKCDLTACPLEQLKWKGKRVGNTKKKKS
jgi:hypothetical protein